MNTSLRRSPLVTVAIFASAALLVALACEGAVGPESTVAPEPPASPAQSGVPSTDGSAQGRLSLSPAAVTGFYYVQESFTCPVGPDCPVPDNVVRALCEPGDVATGGSAWARRTTDNGFAFPGGQDLVTNNLRGWQLVKENDVADGHTLIVRAVCADIG